jgi:polyphenol oxidase
MPRTSETTTLADLSTTKLPALAAVPGLLHGFEQRQPQGRSETRDETRGRGERALAPWGRLFLLKQVHGRTVVEAPFEGMPSADAAVTSRPGVLLGIETADCLPVLLVDPGRRLVAAAHAGWRGTAHGVVAAAVAALRARGSDPGELLAALGPGIGPCCYEVGDELRTNFGPRGAAFFSPGPRGRPHLDVRAANRAQLEASGLRPERIHDLAHCTFCRPDAYHSFRRDGANSGRMISFVGFAAAGVQALS